MISGRLLFSVLPSIKKRRRGTFASKDYWKKGTLRGEGGVKTREGEQGGGGEGEGQLHTARDLLHVLPGVRLPVGCTGPRHP